MAKITPLGHRVLAKQIEAKEETDSGILLPESAKDKQEVAEVVAVGSEVTGIKEGDTVVYNTFKSPIKVDGEEYLILAADRDDKEGDILATIK